jgi:RimJ/RimL family protein N-acetyltransferase
MDSTLERRQTTARLILRRPDASDRDFKVDLFSRVELVAHRPNPVPDFPPASEELLTRDIEHRRLLGLGRWALALDAWRVFGLARAANPVSRRVLERNGIVSRAR